VHGTSAPASPAAHVEEVVKESNSDSADELNIGPSGSSQHAQAAVSSLAESDPRSYAEAIHCWDGARWIDASNKEINNHMRNGTWDLVKAPQGAVVIGSGWVYRVKRKADGSIERYKARLVAKGYSQRPGYDFGEVFAPTFRMASLCLLLAQCAKQGMHLRSVDMLRHSLVLSSRMSRLGIFQVWSLLS
jgi:hypothetical protein